MSNPTAARPAGAPPSRALSVEDAVVIARLEFVYTPPPGAFCSARAGRTLPDVSRVDSPLAGGVGEVASLGLDRPPKSSAGR
jgi:hypothetical protein